MLALLTDAVSDGRLTPDEHAERVQRACTARTLGELADLTTDLAVASAQPVRLDGGRVISGIFGPATRGGRWVVPETLTVTAMFGEVEVESEQILQIYEDRTHRERPNFGRVKEILNGFRHRGLVRIVEQDEKLFTLFLRPALPIVVSKDTLGSLEEFVMRSSAAAEKAETQSETLQ